jgi:hypothetical protein
MEKSHLALVTPATVYGTLDKAGPPKRRRNAEVRSREYLTDAEVNRLISAAGENRNGHRDATISWSPTAMACGRASWSRCAGMPSILPIAASM